MKIHVLQCGSIRVDPTVPFGKRFDLIEAAKQLTAADIKGSRFPSSPI